ncbi:MAG: hypothetical protein IID36_12545, partial [Planctomycetes bacterium]|nr:hypothetical protein [Planctomycetota bacterium]
NARLCVATGRKLTVHGDSTVDGVFEFGCKVAGFTCLSHLGPGTLEIDDSLTISGDGGDIRCLCIDGIIKAAAGVSPVLTLEQEPDLSPLCEFPVADCDILRIDANNQHTLDVQIELINNASVGCSGDDECVVKLTNSSKSGCGFWYAEDGGLLDVQAEVTGDGTWWMNHVESEIEINTNCTGLTGRIEIHSGLFDVNASFCTVGGMEYEAGLYNGAATIEVAPSKYFSVGGSCLSGN